MENVQRAVLFVDVTDSTKLYESLGDTVALALINGVFERLEKIVARYAGAVVKSLGDGIICVFEDPDNAFRAAVEIQTSVRAAAQETANRLQLKIGFTWGPVILSKGDVYGDTMNVCARLVTLANPEQILTSAPTVDALSPGLRTRCRALFPTRIKGKADEVAVSEVLWRYDPAITEANLVRADFARAVQTSLKLIYRGNIFIVNRSRPMLQMGRDQTQRDRDREPVRVARPCARAYARRPFRAHRPVEQRHLPDGGRAVERGAPAARGGGAQRARLDRAGQERLDARRPLGAFQPAGGIRLTDKIESCSPRKRWSSPIRKSAAPSARRPAARKTTSS